MPAGFTKTEADQAEQLALAAVPTCQVFWPSPYQVCGVIRDKYVAMGGPGSYLSYPRAGEMTNPGATGTRQEFLNGSIYQSTTGGAHPVSIVFMTKWQQYGWETGVLGYPTTDEFIVGTDGLGRRQEFQGAGVYWHPVRGSISFIRGAIRDKWQLASAQDGFHGYPVTDEIAIPDGVGRFNRFEYGAIYWSPTTGAHHLTGDIYAKWASLGYEAGALGYPTTDEIVLADGIGRKQEFQRGSIYWHPIFRAHAVFGPLRDRWGQLGWESGALGYPLSDIVTAGGDWVGVADKRIAFVRGGLFLNSSTNQVFDAVRNDKPDLLGSN